MKRFTAIIVAAVLVCMAAGCRKSETEEVRVYFCDKQRTALAEETRRVKSTLEAKDKVKAALVYMTEGPHSEKNAPVISKEAKILSVNISEKVATVDFSKEYSEKNGTDALLLRFAAVSTVCSVSGVDGVVITVEGQPLKSESTGKEIGVMTLSDIAMETNEQDLQKKVITLYFPSENGDCLIRETRSVATQNTLSAEKTIVNELMKGPTDDKCVRSLPEEVRLLNIETKDGVCYVNFSGEFVTKIAPSTNQTTLALYSVVNSICNLENINGVSILVNGENGVEFGNFVLDIPYEANMDIVK